MIGYFSEAGLEKSFVEDLVALGFSHLDGIHASPDAKPQLRSAWRETILAPVLLDALRRINPVAPDCAIEEASRKLTDTVFATDAVQENRRIHELLAGGVLVTTTVDGEERDLHLSIIDWTDDENVWHAVNQFDVAGKSNRTPDVVLFLNGLPLVVVELKGITGAGIEAAFNQIQTYQDQIPDLFRTTLLSVVSDGLKAKYGSLSADLGRFMNWRTVDGETLVAPGSELALQTLTKGLLNRRTLLDMLRWFTVFEDEGRGPIKKIAGYHQLHAVRKALETISEARGGDGKGGVLWHTQGSGKSLLMAFLSGRVMNDVGMENPTLLVLTDRNDLDNQLFATFSRCRALFGEDPVQAGSTDDLKRLLDRKVGGVVFSTIQKFRPEKGADFPQLTERSNVVVLVDEAHRTQYGFEAKLDKGTGEIRHGLAHHLRKALPNAVYVAFTGTPVDLVGADTRAVFGDYIDVYDVAQAVTDGATVPIYYEGRVAKVEIDEELAEGIDEAFEDATEDLEEDDAGALAKKWTRIEALVGADKRLDKVVDDILTHFEARLVALGGKAMIVCMSRRICAALYERIVAARPDWHGETDDAGAVKVVMTGSASDPKALQPHIRSKGRQEAIRNRFKNPDDPLKLVIVRDMWLTGFDAPVMHTLYVDKPMRGHGLMQAIARVNRVFRDKPAGLVVDYIGLAAELRSALGHYSKADQNQTGIDEREAVKAFLDTLDVARSQFHGFDYGKAIIGTKADRLAIFPAAIEFMLQKDRDENTNVPAITRFNDAVAALAKAYKLASGSPEATQHAIEVAFFSAVRIALDKLNASGTKGGRGDPDFAIQQLVNKAVASTEIVDILEACGFDRPDISVLSEEFLNDLQTTK